MRDLKSLGKKNPVSVRLRPESQKVSWRNWQHAYVLETYIERCESSTLSEITKKGDSSEIGYVKTGKKYNVSDNCIRKWIKYMVL